MDKVLVRVTNYKSRENGLEDNWVTDAENGLVTPEIRRTMHESLDRWIDKGMGSGYIVFANERDLIINFGRPL